MNSIFWKLGSYCEMPSFAQGLFGSLLLGKFPPVFSIILAIFAFLSWRFGREERVQCQCKA